MPKRASDQDTVDPVRSRLAGAAAAASTAERPTTTPPPASRARTQARRTTRKNPNARATVNRKFMVTEAEAERMAEVTQSISRAFGGKVGHSLISRALWTVLGDMEERIERLGKGDPRPLPSTGDSDAQAEYEVAVYELISSILTRGG